MRNYVGITIGPIGDTIGDATSPAALWFASSLFSDIAKRICENIVSREGFKDVTLYSPFYSPEVKTDDGVGKFHDRIIFSTTDFSHEKLRLLIEKVKAETILLLPENLQSDDAVVFFKEYLQIHYVVKSEEMIGNSNAVVELSPYLDALELMKTFPKNDFQNPIRKLFLGEDKNDNKYIKNSGLYKQVVDEANQLKKKNGQIWTIGEIASCHGTLTDNYKRRHYYAVVFADGDGMGKFLNKLSGNRVTEFSKCCLDYAQSAAELIGAYGGMTIYAGGDDLLFLAPVMTATDDIFSLCNQIQKLFADKLRTSGKFDDIIELPTVSFGISIQYKKFPLYEAVNSASNLLALAKKDGDFSNKDCFKNNMAIELQKHSGQSIALLVANDTFDVFRDIMKIGNDLSNDQRVIHSVLYTLDTFKSMIVVLNQEAKANRITFSAYKSAWENFFDNIEQIKAKEYIAQICSLYYDNFVVGDTRILVPVHGLRSDYIEKPADAIITDKTLLSLIYLLKLKQFFTEEEGKEHEVSGKDDTP